MGHWGKSALLRGHVSQEGREKGGKLILRQQPVWQQIPGLGCMPAEVGFSLSRARDWHATFWPVVGHLCACTDREQWTRAAAWVIRDAPASFPQQLPAEPVDPERPHLSTFRFRLYLQVLSRNFHTWFHKHMPVHIPVFYLGMKYLMCF